MVTLACFEKVRTLASAGGPDNLVLLDPGKYKAKSRSPESPAGESTGAPPKWLVGEQEFEALMRMLDNLVREHCCHLRTKGPWECAGGAVFWGCRAPAVSEHRPLQGASFYAYCADVQSEGASSLILRLPCVGSLGARAQALAHRHRLLGDQRLLPPTRTWQGPL